MICYRCCNFLESTFLLVRQLSTLLVVQPRHSADDHLQEALRLGKTYSHQECDYLLLGRSRWSSPNMGWYFGSGTVDSLKTQIESNNEVFINAVLTGIQIRNLETKLECRVLDRIALIVEIFANRAKTKEARLQVELAMLQLARTRLIRSMDSTGRRSSFGLGGALQVVSGRDRGRGGGVMGGIGGGGQGESELALHRSRLLRQEKKLRMQIDDVIRTRTLQRRGRKRNRVPAVAVIGYTNAGKSTLVSRLTRSDLECDDLYFKTLDPVNRRLSFANGEICVVSDTVGFISDLPVCLFAAFRSTLEEARYADIILHVIDTDASNVKKQRLEVYKTLREIGVDSEILKYNVIEVYNKIDKVQSSRNQSLVSIRTPNQNQLLITSNPRYHQIRSWIEMLNQEEGGFLPKRVFISALDGMGISDLKDSLQMLMKRI